MANSIMSDHSDIRALVAVNLIALNKCSGVRPVRVGETLSRMVGKAICLATRLDAEEVTGVSQLCVLCRRGGLVTQTS